MKNIILLTQTLIISCFIFAQNESYITYIDIPKKNLIESNFYHYFHKSMDDSCFYEFIETAEIKNISRIKNNLAPIYLQKNRENILTFVHYDYSDKPIYVNDSLGTQIAYKAYESKVKLHKSDSVKFLLKFNIEKGIVKAKLLGIRFIFNKKQEGKKETPVKILYYHWNDLCINKKMFRYQISFNFNHQKVDFVNIEKSKIAYQKAIYTGYFSFDYFEKFTLEKFIFLEELKDRYPKKNFNLIFRVENSKLRIEIQVDDNVHNAPDKK